MPPVLQEVELNPVGKEGYADKGGAEKGSSERYSVLAVAPLTSS